MKLKLLYHVPFSDKPYCVANEKEVYGVATGETVRVSCDVMADPSSRVQFEWVFNTSTSGQEWRTVKGDNEFGFIKGNNKIRQKLSHNVHLVITCVGKRVKTVSHASTSGDQIDKQVT